MPGNVVVQEACGGNETFVSLLASPDVHWKGDLGSRRCLSFVAVAKVIRTQGTRGHVYSLAVELVSQVRTHAQAHQVAHV